MSQFQKLQTMLDIEHYADYQMICGVLLKWQEKSQNKDLDNVIKAVNSTFFYIHNLQEWRRLSELSYAEFRSDKLRAIERAQNAELKIAELESELKKLKQISNL
tara:strand:+ start:824 stop:1135 length:312 start_codon:yes stop_codon:yes gene_type:complete